MYFEIINNVFKKCKIKHDNKIRKEEKLLFMKKLNICYSSYSMRYILSIKIGF